MESDGAKFNDTADKDNEPYEYVTETDSNAISFEEVEKDTSQESRSKSDHNSYEVYGYKDYNDTDYYNVENTTDDGDDKSYEYVAEPDPDAISYEEEDYRDEGEDFSDKGDLGDRIIIAKGISQRPYH